jgi:hypothetical protein
VKQKEFLKYYGSDAMFRDQPVYTMIRNGRCSAQSHHIHQSGHDFSAH